MDPSQFTVDNWPSAIVLIVFLLVVVALPSVLSWLGNRRVKSVEKQFENNGGSTLKDAVDRIEQAVSAQQAALTEHIEIAEERDAQRDATLQSIDARMAKVETDAAHEEAPQGLLRRFLPL